MKPVFNNTGDPLADMPRLGRYDDVLGRLVAESRRAIASYAEVRERMSALRTSATSKDRAVTVEIGPGGALVDITFATRAYRDMAPAELSALILQTVAQARQEYGELMRAQLATFTSALPVEDVLSGTFDPRRLAGPSDDPAASR
jgi:DNA-binding protein YbaB